MNATYCLQSFRPLVQLSPVERSQQLDAVYDAFCKMCEAGVHVDPDEYCDRYPTLKASLRRMLEAHYEANGYVGVAKKLAEGLPKSGGSFQNYDLISQLGKGAFAKVYLARERDVGNRLVALKLSLQSDHEANTLGKLSHPNVVPILSTQHDGALGLTSVCMPYLGGATLCNVLDEIGRQKQLPTEGKFLLAAAHDDMWLEEDRTRVILPARPLNHGSYVDGVVYLGTRMADALDYVHTHNILHRDLKPSNVLLRPDGEPVLLDFNLALSNDGPGYRVAGTIPYMPPEQLLAIARSRAGHKTRCDADARTDVYGLGVLLYELLTGAHPFGPVPVQMKSEDGCRLILDSQRRGPRPLREMNPQVDSALQALVMRCIAWDPNERPTTARDLGAALANYLSTWYRTRRWVARHAVAAATAGMLAVSGTAYGAYEIATMPTTAARHSQSADEHIQSGRFAEAEQAFSLALENDPNQPMVRFKRGRVRQQLGLWVEAREDFHTILKEVPEEMRGRVLACRAFCDYRKEKPENASAIKGYHEAIKAGFHPMEVYNNLALSYDRAGKLEEAERCASMAIDAITDPGQVAAAYLNHAHAVALLVMRDKAFPTIDPAIGVTEFRTVFAQGPGTMFDYEQAAVLCRYALDYRNRSLDDPKTVANDPHYAWGREFTRLAIESGKSTEDLKHEGHLKHWVKSLTVAPNPNPPAVGFDRWLDPLRSVRD